MNKGRGPAGKFADARAHEIASVAAEILVRSEGTHTGAPNTFAIPQCQADDHFRNCVDHLCWHGRATSHETGDGYTIVRLGAFPPQWEAA